MRYVRQPAAILSGHAQGHVRFQGTEHTSFPLPLRTNVFAIHPRYETVEHFGIIFQRIYPVALSEFGATSVI